MTENIWSGEVRRARRMWLALESAAQSAQRIADLAKEELDRLEEEEANG